MLKRVLELQSATAHETLEGKYGELVRRRHLTRHIQDRGAVDSDPIIRDEFSCLSLVASQSARYERCVDSTRAHHALGTEHKIGKAGKIIEHAIWCNSAVVGRLAHSREH